jgi:hypothetical protein
MISDNTLFFFRQVEGYFISLVMGLKTDINSNVEPMGIDSGGWPVYLSDIRPTKFDDGFYSGDLM